MRSLFSYSFIKKHIDNIKSKFIPHNLKYKPWGVNNSKKGVIYHEIYPPRRSILTFHNDLYDACAYYIMTPKIVDVPTTYVVEVTNGRIYATQSFIAIIDSANSLVPEVSYQHVAINRLGDPAGNQVFKVKYFIEPKTYNGTVFSMLSGGGAVKNYGHWLIDAIPRIGLLKKSGLFNEVDYFLVPAYKYDFHHETLSLLGISKEQIIVDNNINHIKADRIIATTTPRHIGHFNSWVRDFLRDTYLNAIESIEYPPMVYIRRSDSSIRRILNEDELVDRLKPLGFVDYELSKLSFAQKVNLFRSAEFVVAATGAGLSNIVFCRKETKVLEIFYSTFISTMFADIASKVDVDYYYLIKKADKNVKNIKEGEIGHFYVDIPNVIEKVESILYPESKKQYRSHNL